jgi:hypothetical protein
MPRLNCLVVHDMDSWSSSGIAQSITFALVLSQQEARQPQRGQADLPFNGQQ